MSIPSIPTPSAISAASTLLAVDVGKHQTSVLLLIALSGDPAEVANAIVRKLLESQGGDMSHRDPNFYRVAFARDIAYRHPKLTEENASQLLDRLCRFGFRCAFVELCSILQQRIPKGVEIIRLTEAYVRDTAMRCESDEEALLDLAKNYDKRTKEKVKELLTAFVDKWDDTADY